MLQKSSKQTAGGAIGSSYYFPFFVIPVGVCQKLRPIFVACDNLCKRWNVNGHEYLLFHFCLVVRMGCHRPSDYLALLVTVLARGVAVIGDRHQAFHPSSSSCRL